jgi:hypothetical protein
LRNMEAAGGTREVRLLGNCNERFELGETHAEQFSLKLQAGEGALGAILKRYWLQDPEKP